MLSAYLDSSSTIGPLEVLVIGLLWVGPAILVARYASRKGQSFGVFLIVALVVSWVIALVAALVVEDQRVPRSVVMASGPTDHLDQLKKLSELRESGTLTPEEFEREKARIMTDRT